MVVQFLRAATFVAAVVGTGAALACAGDHPTSPQSSVFSAARVPSSHPVLSRAKAARVAAIQQRAADVKRRGLRADERARIKVLSNKFKWVGDVHHTAMQQAIHDPSVFAARDRRALDARCEVQVRYLMQYFPQVEPRMRARFDSPAGRREAMRSFAAKAGDCVPDAASETALHSMLARTRGSPELRVDTASTRWVDYIASIVNGLQTAKSLDDARAMIDAHVAAALDDDSLTVRDVEIVAAAAELTTSSAVEWDTYFRPAEASLFIWGWLSALGDWIVEVVTADVVGCLAGAFGTLVAMGIVEWSGDGDAFASAIAGGCEAGGIVGSVIAAF